MAAPLAGEWSSDTPHRPVLRHRRLPASLSHRALEAAAVAARGRATAAAVALAAARRRALAPLTPRLGHGTDDDDSDDIFVGGGCAWRCRLLLFACLAPLLLHAFRLLWRAAPVDANVAVAATPFPSALEAFVTFWFAGVSTAPRAVVIAAEPGLEAGPSAGRPWSFSCDGSGSGGALASASGSSAHYELVAAPPAAFVNTDTVAVPPAFTGHTGAGSWAQAEKQLDRLWPDAVPGLYAQGQLLRPSRTQPSATSSFSLPRSALALPGAGLGALHAPLPVSWAIAQAPMCLAARPGHSPHDRAMVSDALGNAYSLAESVGDALEPGSAGSFTFLSAAAAEAAALAGRPIAPGPGAGAAAASLAALIFAAASEEALPPRLPGEAAEEQECSNEVDSHWSPPLPPLAHPPTAGRLRLARGVTAPPETPASSVLNAAARAAQQSRDANSELGFLLSPERSDSAQVEAETDDVTALLPPSAVAADEPHLAIVHDVARHAWAAYRASAWGRDALKPVSRTGEDSFGGMGLFLVDSLDTLLLLGPEFRQDFDDAVSHIVEHLVLDVQEDINVFEVTIRVLGGLLAAYELGGRRDPRLLAKAVHVADKISFAFESPSGLPYGTLGMKSRRKYNPAWVAGSTLAEVATLTLEWEHLSHLSGDPRYALLVRRAIAHLLVAEVPSDSLFPTYISPDTGDWVSTQVTLGARGDSSYEYLLKPYLLAGGMRDTRVWAEGNASSWKGRGIAGNAALLRHSSDSGVGTITTASYAPPASSRAGSVWRACAASVENGRLGVDNVDTHSYADSMGAYEVRAQQLLARALRAGDEAGSVRPGARQRPPRRGHEPVPSFHPAAFLHPYEAPVTLASEASWFSALLGLHLRAAAGIEHQLLRVTPPPLVDAQGPVGLACSKLHTQYTALLQRGDYVAAESFLLQQPRCLGAGALSQGGRYTVVVERRGDAQPPATPSDSLSAAMAEAAHSHRQAAEVALAARTTLSDAVAAHAAAVAAEVEGEPREGLGRERTRELLGAASAASTAAESALEAASAAAGLATAIAAAALPASPPAFTYEPRMDHLVCFLPGHLALSSTVAPTRALRRRHLALAKRLMRSCVRMYSATATGLAAEIYTFNRDLAPDPGAKHSLLRPETAESLFLLFRTTGDQVYRDWGADILAAINAHARVPGGGFASVADVTVGGKAAVIDQVESFFFSETLKYLLLLFSGPDVLPLDQWVFTTEAHPLRVWTNDERVHDMM